MHRLFLFIALAAAAGPLGAQQLAARCGASSSFDLTVQPDELVFDRAAPAPSRVVIAGGRLQADGRAVPLSAENEDRLALFERALRALVPRIRTVAQHGVDLAVQSLREEAAGMALGEASRAELDRRLAADAADLHRRIAHSNSTHDWQGDAAQALGDQVVGDLAPIVAGDLGQQALQAALAGDLQTAARLRDQAADLATALRPRLERRMNALAPEVDALCPAIRRLAELQQGVPGPDGRPLRLLDAGAH